jgi:RNA polymerase sigma-70 factor (ECF subfamily)
VYLHQGSNDAELVQRSLEGDFGAFEALVQEYQGVLFTVAYRMLGDYEDARDATQNAFIKVFQRLETFDRQRRFFSWIYRILVNECLNAKRDRRVSVEISDREASTSAGPDEPLAAAERQLQVRRAVLTLSPDYREVIVLRHFGGLSYDEMAEALQIPVRTVKSRLYTARHRLMEALSALQRR